jgi:hypothetical protein
LVALVRNTAYIALVRVSEHNQQLVAVCELEFLPDRHILGHGVQLRSADTIFQAFFIREDVDLPTVSAVGGLEAHFSGSMGA